MLSDRLALVHHLGPHRWQDQSVRRCLNTSLFLGKSAIHLYSVFLSDLNKITALIALRAGQCCHSALGEEPVCNLYNAAMVDSVGDVKQPSLV